MVSPQDLTDDVAALKNALDNAIANERSQLDAYVAAKVAEAIQPLQQAVDLADGQIKDLIQTGISNVQSIVPSEAPSNPVDVPLTPTEPTTP